MYPILCDSSSSLLAGIHVGQDEWFKIWGVKCLDIFHIQKSNNFAKYGPILFQVNLTFTHYSILSASLMFFHSVDWQLSKNRMSSSTMLRVGVLFYFMFFASLFKPLFACLITRNKVRFAFYNGRGSKVNAWCDEKNSALRVWQGEICTSRHRFPSSSFEVEI